MTIYSHTVSAQTPAIPAMATATSGNGGPGIGSSRPAVVSPEVRDDRTVTLRYLAPNATQVTVSGEIDGQSHSMTKGADGVWSVTLGPLLPDIYTYRYNVDGVVAIDPRNANTKIGYSGFGAASVVQVPGDGPQFYDVKNVPHGEVRIRPYVSKTLGVSRTAWIYTPPGYERFRKLPVLYLLHGAGDLESSWTMMGRANNIIDNLIAEGKARPMVVVMPLGHAVQSVWTGPAKAVVPTVSSVDPKKPTGLSMFALELIEEVIPMVESNYLVSSNADDRAIAGLSMGGGQAMNIALTRPELFRYVVAMSPAAKTITEQNYPRLFKEPGSYNQQFKMLWISVGDQDTLTGPEDISLSETLKRAGVHHSFKRSSGRHEWTVWRNYLYEVLPLLFR